MPTVIGDQAHGMRLATRELLEELESLLAAPCLDPGWQMGKILSPVRELVQNLAGAVDLEKSFGPQISTETCAQAEL